MRPHHQTSCARHASTGVHHCLEAYHTASHWTAYSRHQLGGLRTEYSHTFGNSLSVFSSMSSHPAMEFPSVCATIL